MSEELVPGEPQGEDLVLASSLRQRLAPGRPDNFQTPPTACDPLFDFIPKTCHVWEPACGNGNIVRAFGDRGYSVIGTDILQGSDFLAQSLSCDVIVTNPPYSLKDAFLARAYELGKPFAFLVPYTTFEGKVRQALFREHGVQVIFLPKRVNFETPSGKNGTAWFPTCWLTHGLDLPQDIFFWLPGQHTGLFEGEAR